MEKKPEKSYKEYAIRWKAMASQVRPPLTHIEINSYFVDTLPSPYYDMLIGNAFLEFGDLLYVVGRIEYGIKKRRIASTEARVPEQRRNVVDEHIRATSCKKGNKRKSNEKEEAIKNLSHSSQVMLSPLQLSVQGRKPDVNSNYFQSSKRKRAKRYHALLVSYAQLLPKLVQKYKIPIVLAKTRKESLHIRNGMTSVLDVNIMAGFKDTLQKAAHHSKIKFRL